MLVAFDPGKPKKPSSGFLVPVVWDGRVALFGTSSKQIVRCGMVIYLGQEVSANDLFARLVDSGCKVPAVEEALRLISAYIDEIHSLRIGRVAEIAGNGTESGLSLKLAEYPKAVRKRRLP